MTEHDLDARGLPCPLPIVLLARLLGRVAAGEVVRVRADDPAFAEDLRAWCRATGHGLLSVEAGTEGVLARVRHG